MKYIKTNEGINVMVDDEDFEFVNTFYNLHLNNGGYVICKTKRKYSRKKLGLYSGIGLHKLLMNPDKTGRKIVVDHWDGNPLNNQKENLRVVFHYQNMRNRKVQEEYEGKKKSSKYKGVSWNKRKGAWRVYFRGGVFMGKDEINEYYSNELAAVNAYNHYALKEYGEFARLNECPYMPYEKTQGFKIVLKEKTSKFRGVSFCNGKWLAQIWDGKRNIRIGEFDNEIECANAYDEMAKEIHKEKAKLNFKE